MFKFYSIPFRYVDVNKLTITMTNVCARACVCGAENTFATETNHEYSAIFMLNQGLCVITQRFSGKTIFSLNLVQYF